VLKLGFVFNRLRLLLLPLFLISPLSSALAQDQSISEPVLLGKLRPAVDGTIHVHTREIMFGCANAFRIPPDHPAGSALYATLLSALLSGKQVRIEVEGTCQTGDAGMPIASVFLLAD